MEKDHLLILWKKCVAGDAQSFDRIYELTINQLFSYGFGLSGDRELTKDAIQELFIYLWRRKTDIDITKSVLAYLFTSLRRIVIKKTESAFSIVPLDIMQHDPADQNIPEHSDSDEFQSIRIKLVKDSFERLPRRQREAMYLKYIDRLDYEEIAEVMSLQVSAVYKLVSKAISKLRNELK